MVEGGGLENRFPATERGFESYSLRHRGQPPVIGLGCIVLYKWDYGEMAELAEGARLLSECAVNAAPRVRIPLSPPISAG